MSPVLIFFCNYFCENNRQDIRLKVKGNVEYMKQFRRHAYRAVSKCYEVNNSKRKWQGNLVPRVSPLASGLETLLV